jgi:hypothetical protein
MRRFQCRFIVLSTLTGNLALANRSSKLYLNPAAAAALSITIKSLSCRLRPGAEKFAALVRNEKAQFNFAFFILTPAPLPFSGMNSTPAASRACCMA